jgi:hypothetical protein
MVACIKCSCCSLLHVDMNYSISCPWWGALIFFKVALSLTVFTCFLDWLMLWSVVLSLEKASLWMSSDLPNSLFVNSVWGEVNWWQIFWCWELDQFACTDSWGIRDCKGDEIWLLRKFVAADLYSVLCCSNLVPSISFSNFLFGKSNSCRLLQSKVCNCNQHQIFSRSPLS